MTHHDEEQFSIVGGNSHSSEGLTIRTPFADGPPLVVLAANNTITIFPNGGIEVKGKANFVLEYDYDRNEYNLKALDLKVS